MRARMGVVGGRRRTGSSALALALVLAACGADWFLPLPALPPEIDLLAAYYRGARDEPVWASSALTPRGSAPRVEFEAENYEPRDGAVLALVGFRAESLGGSLDLGAQRGRLEAANNECWARLPTPDLHVALEGDGALEAELRLPGLGELCERPTTAEPPLVELRCGVIHCTAAGVAAEGCGFEIRAPECGLDLLAGRRLPHQAVCVDGALEPRCQAHPGDPTALLDLTCELPERSCRVRAFERQPPVLVASAHEPFGEVREIDHHGTGRLALGPDKLRMGFVTDLARSGDRLAATWHGGALVSDAVRPPLPPTELWFLDPASLTAVSTAPIPFVSRLAWGGVEARLHGLGIAAGSFVLLSFDLEGRVIARLNLGVSWPAADGEYPYDGVELLAEPGAPRLVVVLSGRAGAVNDLVIVVDASAWRVERTLELSLAGTEPLRIATARLASPGEVALLTEAALSLEWLDLETEARRSLALNPTGRVIASGSFLHGLMIGSSPGLALVAIAGGSAGVIQLRDGQQVGRAPPFELPLDLTVLAPRPDSAGRVLASGAAGRGQSSKLTAMALEYDVERERFLPGAIELGSGVASRIVPLGEARFILLPWSATIVRVTRTEN